MNQFTEPHAMLVKAYIEVINVLEFIYLDYVKVDDEKLYDSAELTTLWNRLQCFYQNRDLEQLHLFLKDSLNFYINPLPIRPFVAALYHARTQMFFSFKKYLELEDMELPKMAEKIFVDSLAPALMTILANHDGFNLEFFSDLKQQFSMTLEKKLKNEFISRADVPTPNSSYCCSFSPLKPQTPSLFSSSVITVSDDYDSDGNEIVSIIVDQSLPATPITAYHEEINDDESDTNEIAEIMGALSLSSSTAPSFSTKISSQLPLKKENKTFFSGYNIEIYDGYDSDGIEIRQIFVTSVKPG